MLGEPLTPPVATSFKVYGNEFDNSVQMASG